MKFKIKVEEKKQQTFELFVLKDDRHGAMPDIRIVNIKSQLHQIYSVDNDWKPMSYGSLISCNKWIEKYYPKQQIRLMVIGDNIPVT